jgi:hypothetical protein
MITMMMRHGEGPDSKDLAPDWKDAVLHARLTLGGTELMGADIPPDRFQPMRSAYLSLTVGCVALSEFRERLLRERLHLVHIAGRLCHRDLQRHVALLRVRLDPVDIRVSAQVGLGAEVRHRSQILVGLPRALQSRRRIHPDLQFVRAVGERVAAQPGAFVRLTLGLGLAGAMWLSRFIQAMLFQVSPIDAPSLVAVAALFLTVRWPRASCPRGARRASIR